MSAMNKYYQNGEGSEIINLDDYDADIDDELDDYSETLANLHEIDIFKEYVPDTY